MEILYLVGIFFGFWLIGNFFSWIGDVIDNHKARVRDRVLSDFLQHTDLTSELNKYKNKLQEIDFKREEGFFEKYSRENNVKLIGEIGNFLGSCPDCNTGTLVARNGRHGKFIGCSNYPKCRHTENVKVARSDYKIAVKNQIMSDIKKAYS